MNHRLPVALKYDGLFCTHWWQFSIVDPTMAAFSASFYTEAGAALGTIIARMHRKNEEFETSCNGHVSCGRSSRSAAEVETVAETAYSRGRA